MYNNKNYPVYGTENYQLPVYGAEQYQADCDPGCNYYKALQQPTYEASCPKPEEYCPYSIPPFMPACPLLAEGYVPYQQPPTQLYQPKEALRKGTLFPELYRPYLPRRKY
jgi:hypothetical protein